MRVARRRTSIEHHGQRGDRQDEDAGNRRSYRAEHISILLDCGDQLGHRSRPPASARFATDLRIR